MKKKRMIVSISIVVIIIILVITLVSVFKRTRVVEVPKLDTIYIEQISRDSIKNEIDSIILSIDKNDKYEKEFYESISDSDSIAILKRFIGLCTE